LRNRDEPASDGWIRAHQQAGAGVLFYCQRQTKKIAEKPFFLFDLCRFSDTLLPSETISRLDREIIRNFGFERRMKK
jgi:hypothetical protein